MLESVDHRAANLPAGGAAAIHQSLENGLDAVEIGKPGPDVDKLALGLFARFGAVRTVLELQQVRHLVQAEPQSLADLMKRTRARSDPP